MNLVSECIPKTRSQIVEVGTAWIVLVYQIDTAQEIHRKQHRFRQSLKPESQAGADFGIIGPILMQPVHGGVVVQIELCLKSKRVGIRECVSALILRVQQHVVLKAAHENPVLVIFEEEALGSAQQMAEGFRK